MNWPDKERELEQDVIARNLYRAVETVQHLGQVASVCVHLCGNFPDDPQYPARLNRTAREAGRHYALAQFWYDQAQALRKEN